YRYSQTDFLLWSEKKMVSCFSPPFCLGKEVSLALLSPFTLSPNVKGGFVALLMNKLCKKVLNNQKSTQTD
ncbi:TPA: hypothetical protein ACF462_001794, partial [Streptococcus pyogenes]